ncbi:MAG: hypothetical protein OXS32_01965 [Verrucomicrobiales bacterium]|nr:hypothetical protein [Verrucomicrobiales bacterium]
MSVWDRAQDRAQGFSTRCATLGQALGSHETKRSALGQADARRDPAPKCVPITHP